jgi:hypothetical protein
MLKQKTGIGHYTAELLRWLLRLEKADWIFDRANQSQVTF